MPATPVDSVTVSTAGLGSSSIVEALVGLRANEARCFSTKYAKAFTMSPADEVP